MISDVLFEAHLEIRRYLDHETYSKVYQGENRERVERLLAELDALRRELDAPPDNRTRAQQHADERAAEIQHALNNGETPASLGWPDLTPEQLVQAEWQAWHDEECRAVVAQETI